MNLEGITKTDLENLIKDISNMVKAISDSKPKKWLRSKEVREMLGISPGTLQNFRINNTIPFTKMGATIFYDYEEILAVLNSNKSNN